MPLEDLQIGPVEIPGVSFFTFQDLNKDSSLTGDGMLSTGIFRRVFICHAHHFVVLDPAVGRSTRSSILLNESRAVIAPTAQEAIKHSSDLNDENRAMHLSRRLKINRGFRSVCRQLFQPRDSGIWFDSDAIIDRRSNPLLAAKVSLGCLN
jgi:hypothetical protein